MVKQQIEYSNLSKEFKASFETFKTDVEEGGLTKLMNSFQNDDGYYPEKLNSEINNNFQIHPSFRKHPKIFEKWAKEKNMKLKREREKGFRLMPFNEFNKKKFKKNDWIIKNFFERGEINLLVGASENYKSWLAMDMAVNISRGLSFMDSFKSKKLNVGYLDKENPERVVQERFRMIMRGKGIRTINNLFLLPDEFAGMLTNCQWLDKLMEYVKSNQIEVLFVDTMHRFGDYKENSSDEVNDFYLNCLKPLQKLGCSLVLIHHTGKNGDFRGSSDIKGMLDNMFSIKKDKYGKSWLNFEKSRTKLKGTSICFKPHFDNGAFRLEVLSDIKENIEKKNKVDILCKIIIKVIPNKKEIKKSNLENLLKKNEVKYGRETLTRALKNLVLAQKLQKIKNKKGFYIKPEEFGK